MPAGRDNTDPACEAGLCLPAQIRSLRLQTASGVETKETRPFTAAAEGASGFQNATGVHCCYRLATKHLAFQSAPLPRESSPGAWVWLTFGSLPGQEAGPHTRRVGNEAFGRKPGVRAPPSQECRSPSSLRQAAPPTPLHLTPHLAHNGTLSLRG
ncbi:hypothetical protein NDU88_007657 [Pleurodeles waltl]|uniref:Uncharacterized protein n=1 Tax=Pleurodeles waltl TaxID=8319 RepID=A0AAV7VUA2_PLEWA|nr:hypothetical protein NDU88_007657 [Pleurodeles waltl]